MKKLFTLLALMCMVCTGAWAQSITGITDEASAVSASSLLTVDQLKGLAGTGKHFAFVNTNTAARGWNTFGGGRPGNLTTSNLYTLVSGSDGKYWVKNYAGQTLTVPNGTVTFSSEPSAQGFDWTIVQDGNAKKINGEVESLFQLRNGNGQQYRVEYKDFGSFPGDWARYYAFGPFYVVNVVIQYNGVTSSTVNGLIVKEGAFDNVPSGYALENPVTFDHDGDYTINFVSSVNFTYSYKYNDVEQYTENVSAIPGANFPNPATSAATAAMPFGIAIGAAPAGQVSAEDEGTTKVIELTSTLPFEFYSTYGEIAKWYALQGNSNTNDHRWVYSNNGALALTNTMSRETLNASEQISDYAWAFIGDPFTGFQIVNKGATEANGGTLRMISDAIPCAFTSEPNIVHFGQGDPNDDVHFSIYKNGTGTGKYYNVRSDGTIKRYSLDKGCTFKAIEFTPKDPIAFALLNRQGVGTHSSLDGKTVGTFSAAYNVALPSGVEAYVASRVGDVLYFESIGSVVPANEGVLLYIENSTENYNGEASYTDESVPTVVSNALQPLLNNAPIEAGDYVLTNAYNGVGFYPRETATTASNKAYIPADLGNGIRGFVFAGEGDITTAISQLSAAQSQTSAYDLAGRRVSAAVKGISIVNGKKLIK